MNNSQATRNEQVIGQQCTALKLSSLNPANYSFFRFQPLMLSLLSVLVVPATQAMDYSNFEENGWSMGMNVGKTVGRIQHDTIITDLEAQGFNVTSVDEARRTEGYKIFAGYQFSPYLALEGGYFNLGGFHALANTEPRTSFRGKTKLLGWNVDVVGIMPFTEDFSAFARLGLTRNDTSNTYSSNGLVDVTAYNEDGNYTKHKYGVGLQYDVSPIFTLRLEAERYRLNDLIAHSGDIDMYSLGAVLRFGKTQSGYAASPAPEPVRRAEVTEATAVAAVTETVAPEQAEVLVLEDVHFNFDTAALTDNTKVILRQHVQTLAQNPDARVRIAGYTSASGSAEYNQALSERRAQSIKAFLILEGVEANRFKTVGFGETNPAEYEARPALLRSDAAKANMRGLFEIIVE